mgnify:FL=1
MSGTMKNEKEMRKCEYAEKISAAYDGELPEGELRELEQHAEQCAYCRRELRQMRTLSELLGEVETPSISSDFLASLHDNVPEANPHRVVLRTARRLMAVAATILLCSVLWLWQFEATANVTDSVPAQWERVVLAHENTGLSESSHEELLAHWIVEDLSGEGAE